jgi:hypothetical protein
LNGMQKSPAGQTNDSASVDNHDETYVHECCESSLYETGRGLITLKAITSLPKMHCPRLDIMRSIASVAKVRERYSALFHVVTS